MEERGLGPLFSPPHPMLWRLYRYYLQANQVHVPQVRQFGRVGEARRPLHTAFEHFQRENLHLLVVLDAGTDSAYLDSRALQVTIRFA